MSSETFPFGPAPCGIPAPAPANVQDLVGNKFAQSDLVASCKQRLSMLRQLLHMTNQSILPSCFDSLKSMNLPQVDSQSPTERRQQERLQARTKLAYMKERKAQFVNCSPSQTQVGKQARRISSFTETAPSRTLKVASCDEDEDNSTICMPVSYSPQEQDMLGLEDIDDIFDDESSFGEDSFEEPVQPVTQPRQSSLEIQGFRRQVSEASFGCMLRLQRQNTHPRNPTPKEAGLSSWDDVSSIATLSRLGSFEPEPLPMGDSPIPLVIYVPTPKTEEDDLEPLRIFPSSQGFPSLDSLPNHVAGDCSNLLFGVCASSSTPMEFQL